jgi:hypothetical protein
MNEEMAAALSDPELTYERWLELVRRLGDAGENVEALLTHGGLFGWIERAAAEEDEGGV